MNYKQNALQEIKDGAEHHTNYQYMADCCLDDFTNYQLADAILLFDAECFRVEAVKRNKEDWLRFRKIAKVLRGGVYRKLNAGEFSFDYVHNFSAQILRRGVSTFWSQRNVQAAFARWVDEQIANGTVTFDAPDFDDYWDHHEKHGF